MGRRHHLVNWATLVTGFTLLLERTNLPQPAIVRLGLGFGAVSAIVWELLEYQTFIKHSKELKMAYPDTLGDLSLGLGGSLVAACGTAWVLSRRRAAADG